MIWCSCSSRWWSTAWQRPLAINLRLSPAEWVLLPEAWWTLYRVDRTIRRRPYADWRHWLDPQQATPNANGNPDRAQAIIRLTERVTRHHLRPMNCLRRTLAEKQLLERRGLGCNLHIGVKAGESGFEAHAWLTDGDGGVLNDSPDVAERYRELSPEQWAATIDRPST